MLAVDTAETLDEKTSNDTALSLAGITDNGIIVVLDGDVGKIPSEDIPTRIMRMYHDWRPNIILLEETSFTRGLAPSSIKREQERANTLATP